MLVHRGDLADRYYERAGVWLPGPLGLAVGFVASIAVTMISWAFGAGADPRIGLVLLTLTAVAVGAVTTVPGAIAAGTLCWACYSGFVLNRLGSLTFDRGGGQALLTIVLSATVASAAVGLMRWAREPMTLVGDWRGLGRGMKLSSRERWVTWASRWRQQGRANHQRIDKIATKG